MSNEYVFDIEFSKSGKPVMWECGGGLSKRGIAQIICAEDGSVLQPLFKKRGGHLANGKHALFVVKPGYHVITATDSSIRVWRIDNIIDNKARVTLVCEWEMGEWDITPPSYLNDAIKAVQEKVNCYHCRHVHYSA